MLIRHSGTNLSWTQTEIKSFSFKKMHLKLLFAKWRPYCLSLNVSTPTHLVTRSMLYECKTAVHLTTSWGAFQSNIRTYDFFHRWDPWKLMLAKIDNNKAIKAFMNKKCPKWSNDNIKNDDKIELSILERFQMFSVTGPDYICFIHI